MWLHSQKIYRKISLSELYILLFWFHLAFIDHCVRSSAAIHPISERLHFSIPLFSKHDTGWMGFLPFQIKNSYCISSSECLRRCYYSVSFTRNPRTISYSLHFQPCPRGRWWSVSKNNFFEFRSRLLSCSSPFPQWDIKGWLVWWRPRLYVQT